MTLISDFTPASGFVFLSRSILILCFIASHPVEAFIGFVEGGSTDDAAEASISGSVEELSLVSTSFSETGSLSGSLHVPLEEESKL